MPKLTWGLVWNVKADMPSECVWDWSLTETTIGKVQTIRLVGLFRDSQVSRVLLSAASCKIRCGQRFSDKKIEGIVKTNVLNASMLPSSESRYSKSTGRVKVIKNIKRRCNFAFRGAHARESDTFLTHYVFSAALFWGVSVLAVIFRSTKKDKDHSKRDTWEKMGQSGSPAPLQNRSKSHLSCSFRVENKKLNFIHQEKGPNFETFFCKCVCVQKFIKFSGCARICKCFRFSHLFDQFVLEWRVPRASRGVGSETRWTARNANCSAASERIPKESVDKKSSLSKVSSSLLSTSRLRWYCFWLEGGTYVQVSNFPGYPPPPVCKTGSCLGFGNPGF